MDCYLKTGDLVLFSGNYCTSKVIKCLSKSKWSHVGLVWENPYGLNGKYLLSSDITDVENGVQLIKLDTMFENYKGEVWYRSINTYDSKRFYLLNPIYKETFGVDYNFFPPDVVRLIYKKYFGCRRKSTKWFVCSTYISYVLTRLGFLEYKTDWTLVHPKDFINNDNLKFVNCTYGELYQIK